MKVYLGINFLNRGSGEIRVFVPRSLILMPFAAGAVILFFVWCMRKLSPRGQFLVLLAMGVSMSFLLLMIVQLPEYRTWLATLLVLIVFIASPFAVRIFLRGLTEEESEQADAVHKHES
jgi:hypothetical protein